MNPYEVIRRPILTEKNTRLMRQENQYTFEVARAANKIQIREAVELAFGVQVLKVRTSVMPGKPRRRGRVVGSSKPWKKAVVTLAPGDRIDIFEGI
ncbi:MAG: 50S ribosomal protein L23 [Chloroflexia bacterium]|nr:50S ribosomal protein L23 [Chloroflexia bacterium]